MIFAQVNPGVAVRLARFAALGAIIVGSAVLIGWAADIAVLKTLLLFSVSMKVNTAVCFVLIGIALLWTPASTAAASPAQPPKLLSRMAWLSGGMAFLIGLLTLGEYLFDWSPGLDQWLFHEPGGTVGTSHPGRMAPETALSFVLLATALGINHARPTSRWGSGCSVAIGLLVLTLALAATLTHLTPELGAFGRFGCTIMAMHTATMFAILGVAVIGKSWQQDALSWSLSKTVTLVFACGMALLVLVGLNASRSQFWLLDTQRRILATQSFVGDIERVVAEATDTVAATRGYVITGDARFLESHRSAAGRIRTQLEAFHHREPVLAEATPQHHFDQIRDRVGALLEWEQETLDRYRSGLSGASRDALIGHGESLLKAFRESVRLVQAEHHRAIDQWAQQSQTVSRRSYLIISVGTLASLLIFLAALFRLNFAESERRRGALSLVRLNRLYAMLSQTNQAIVRSANAPDLFEQICQIAVEHGGFALAWIGLSGTETGPLRCVARSGKGPIDIACLLAAAAHAVGSGQQAVSNDLIGELGNAGCRELAREAGLAASGVFPIRQHGRVIGALSLYAAEKGYFSPDVHETLREMAMDVSYALDHFEREAERSSALMALRESEERFRHISSTISDIAYSCATRDGRYVIEWMTGAVERITGYAADEVRAMGCWRCLVHEEDRGRFDQEVIGLAEGSSGTCEVRLRRRSGEVAWVASFAECVADPDVPERKHIYGALIDITATHAAAERLRLHAAVMDSTRDGVVITDLKGCILAVNRAYVEITGYAEAEVLGQNPRMLQSGRHDKAFYQSLWNELLETGQWQGEIWNRRKNGEIYPEWLTLSTVRDAERRPTHYVAVFTDISQLKQSEARLQRLAHYDPLTDLPNRTLVQFQLEHALEKAQRGKHQVGVLFIDLDRFKNINDSLGHSSGDLILREVSKRLGTRVRKSDTLGRLGGDEFLVVLEHLERPDDSAGVARALLATLDESFSLPQGREVYIRASIGISLYPENGRTPEELIRNADAAMYQVKDSGRNAYAYYTPALTLAANERLHLETRLRRALERQEFVICYQPIVTVADGRLIGAEALVRWQPPGEPLVPPAAFIPLAEETSLIVPLGEWVLRQACAQAKAWQDAGLSFEQVAINLSVRQFQHPGLARTVHTVLAETELAPDCLELEITESSLMGTGEQVVANLRGIKGMGLRLSIDDFGTGYSSLAYLKRLPLDRLKIDYSFIHDIPDDPNDAAIASTIIAMAHRLGLQAVAEGVESEVQLDFLKSEGCDAYQGYLCSPPLPPDEFERRFLR